MNIKNSWITEELRQVSIGDKRLNKRILKLGNDLASQPSAPINQASEDWASTKASYRLFDNEKITPSKIMEPHFENTVTRSLEFPYVLVVQDTSVIDFSKHQKTKGIGVVGGQLQVQHKTQGLIMHSALALSPAGRALGLVSNFIWNRSGVKDKTMPNSSIPTEMKESYKWVASHEEYSNRIQKKLPIVTIADREADFYDFFLSHYDSENFFIVRSFHNRLLRQHNQKIHDLIKNQEPFSEKLEIQIPTRNRAKGFKPTRSTYTESTSYRHAQVQIYKQRIELDAPKKSNGQVKQKLYLNHIYVQEINPPSTEEKLEWHILTNLEVDGLDDALRVVETYKLRWNIEIFFKVLKSGCKIEDCRLGSAKRLMNFIALKSIIAWRLFLLTSMSREQPDSSCDLVLREVEWQTLYKRIHKTNKPPVKIPNIKEVPS